MRPKELRKQLSGRKRFPWEPIYWLLIRNAPDWTTTQHWMRVYQNRLQKEMPRCYMKMRLQQQGEGDE